MYEQKNQIQIKNLKKIQITDLSGLKELINKGNKIRVTSKTGKNNTSSRSHAILQFTILLGKKQKGMLSFIDLAGNERGSDTYNHN